MSLDCLIFSSFRCSISSDLTRIGEAECSFKASGSSEGKGSVTSRFGWFKPPRPVGEAKPRFILSSQNLTECVCLRWRSADMQPSRRLAQRGVRAHTATQ